jgi:dienelactone hydrolase
MVNMKSGCLIKINSFLLLFVIMLILISPLYAQEIRIKPEKSLVDQPISLNLSGFDPSKTVTLKANMEDEFGQDWDSYAVFEVNRTGFADLSHQSPIGGTYKGIDPTGLIWSLSKDPGKKNQDVFMSKTMQPMAINFSAEVDGKTVATKSIERKYLSADVDRIDVNESGLVGTFFAPNMSTPSPGIMIIGGADGNLREDLAGLLASHGYATLAIAYFGREGLPDEPLNVPLEYFGKAIEWMKSNDAVDSDKIGIVGWSKGGEGALLVGSTYPDIKAVVSLAGSGVVFQAIANDYHVIKSPWSYNGKDVPYIRFTETPLFILQMIITEISGGPLSLNSMFTDSLKNRTAMDHAKIDLDKINGPVMIVSGDDDEFWPSEQLSQIASKGRKGNNYSSHDRYMVYSGAGHNLGIPNLPTTGDCLIMPANLSLHLGGAPSKDARARADSWQRMLQFLDLNLMDDGPDS